MTDDDEDKRIFGITPEALGELAARGIPTDHVKVFSSDVATTADYLICTLARFSGFADNLAWTCSECGVAIVYRHHSPEHAAKICILCALARFGKDVMPP